jgi:ubiquinone/menaquinone biosynthesis C-methylase UbiE
VIEWNSVDSFVGNRSDPRATILRPCPICGHSESTLLLSFADFQFFTDDASDAKRVDIRDVVCASCHAVFLNPVYTPMGFRSLFAEAGCSYGATAGRSREQERWLENRGLLRAGASLLDVGCYDGDFLAQLPDSVKRIGVDIDLRAIERGTKKFGARGIEFIYGDFNDFRMSESPDAITMFHVLEHLPDPVKTLSNLRAMSGPGTRLVVEIPIVENGLTNDINGFLSAQHLTHFSRRTLTNALARSGWNVIERFEQSDYNGCRVMAEPVEASSRVSGDEADVEAYSRYMTHWRRVVANVSSRLNAIGDATRIVLWGGGLHTEFLYHLTPLFKDRRRQFAIVDSDRLKQGRSWRGISIFPPSKLSEVSWETSRMVISSYGGQPEIAVLAQGHGVPSDKLIQLYDHFFVY